MAGLLLHYHLNRLARYFGEKRLARGITAFLFLAILGGVALGIYFFTREGLRYVTSDPFFLEAMPLYIYELFFLALLYPVLLSSFIVGLFSLFQGRNDGWIMASPRFQTMPPYLTVKALFSSLWPLFVVILPALLAIREVFGVGMLGFLASLSAAVLLLVFTVLVTLALLFALAKLLYALRVLSTARLVGGIVVVIAIVSFLAWQGAATGDVVELFHARHTEEVSAGIDAIVAQFRLFPSHLAASVVSGVQRGAYGAALVSLLLLGLFCGAAGALLRRLARAYLPLWQILQEGHLEARGGSLHAAHAPVRFPRYFRGKGGAILEKESLLMVRNLKNLLWFGFVVALWLIQTSLNFFAQRNIEQYGAQTETLPAAVQALQVVVAVYFVAALALRFAFPSFSTERRTAWILGSAPLSLRRIFAAKFLFFTSSFTVLAFLIALANTAILEVSFPYVGVFLAFAALSAFVVTTLGLALGAIFPSFETDDPHLLSTSLPGLFFTALSLGYGALGAWLFYAFLLTGALLPPILFTVFSFLLVAFLLVRVPQALAGIEFVRVR